MALDTFEEALADAERFGSRPHVLLGNGFSIACRPDRFSYGALLDEAEFAGGSGDLRAVFGLLGTTDFEKVIELLRLSADLCEGYGTTDDALIAQLRNDADVVRDALARVLAARHPDTPYEIEEHEFQAARQFLAHFDRIYTVNYDMLLYWTVMQDLDPYVERNDGFGFPDDEDATYVTWKPYEGFTDQRIFYLHGSLHLYDAGNELDKITWARTGIPLVTQIRDALDSGRYPLIVTEGSSEAKVTKILHSAYLNHAIRSLSNVSKPLFIYGLSLAPNDDHFLRRIAEGKIPALYVSIYGDPDSAENQAVMEAADSLSVGRPDRHTLQVSFFDAETAHVWS